MSAAHAITGKWSRIVPTLLLPLLLGAAGCAGSGDPTPIPVNLPPSVTDVSATPSLQVLPGDEITLQVEVRDPEDDAFTLSWSAPAGSFAPPDAASTHFTVPEHLGPLELTLTMTDARGASSSFSLFAVIGVLLSEDADLDGYTWEAGDCNDFDASISPAAVELVDGKDNDCDSDVDEGSPVSDDDGDLWSEVDGDCDDSNPNIHPTRIEQLDGLDNDCDGFIDEDTAGSDDDGDGFPELEGDCNDARLDVYPGATEVADGVDNDCDGRIDEDTVASDDDGDGQSELEGDCDDAAPLTYAGALEQDDSADNDCDGRIDEGSSDLDDDGDGKTELEGDCDDTRAEVSPGAGELPDGLDNDCDGHIDEGTVAGDDDSDGSSEVQGDCDDSSPTTYPEADELADGLDNDCDGRIDEGTPAYDNDGDGTSPNQGDCDDANPSTHPGALEVADTLDNDCDGLIDEGTPAYDDDGDGFSEQDGDCDDAAPGSYPGAEEILDGQDNNCDGVEDPNEPPVAVASVENPGLTCSDVILDGSGSTDPEGGALRYYQWFVVEVPDGSAVTDDWIQNADAAITSVVTDLPGTYHVGLVVSDGKSSSEVSAVSFTVADRGNNDDPVAEAGTDQTASQTVQCAFNGTTYVCPACSTRTFSLQGDGSSDPDDDRLFFQWSVSSSSTSLYTLRDPTSASPTLELAAPPAERGRSNTWTLFLKLEVKDCLGERDIDSVVVSYTCTAI